MLHKLEERLLKELQTNSHRLLQYSQGLELIKQSGVLELLKLLYRPKVILHGVSQQESMAISGSYSAGAMDVLSVLENFRELYLETISPHSQPAVSFNSVEFAVSRGNLTKEEADAIRNGRKPDYTKFTTPAKSSASGTTEKPI